MQFCGFSRKIAFNAQADFWPGRPRRPGQKSRFGNALFKALA